jgi:hypothetical protein
VAAAAGLAPAVEELTPANLWGPGKKPRLPSATSVIAVVVQPGFAVNVPPAPLPIAAILVKSTVPKSDSGSVVHLNELHVEGASAIHSAEVRSGFANVSFFVNDVWRVRFFT